MNRAANSTIWKVLSIALLMSVSAGAGAADPCDDVSDLLNKTPPQIEEYLEGLSRSTLKALEQAAIACAKQETANASIAAAPSDQQQLTDKANKAKAAADQVKGALNDLLDFGGFNFAAGLGVMALSNGDVKNATIDNGVVRVTEQDRQQLGLWLSTNTFFKELKDYRLGWFLGAQLGGDDKVLNGLATGLAISSSRETPKGKGNAPLVLQVGWGWTRVQRLAEGYVDGQPPPAGATQPLFKKTTQDGLVLMLSYSFL